MTVTVTATAASTAAFATASSGLIEDYRVVPSTQILNVSLDCPTMNKQRYQTKLWLGCPNCPKDFVIVCGRDIYQAPSHAVALVAYRIEDCIENCGCYEDSHGTCMAISFHTLMNYNDRETQNCWLFTGNYTSAPTNVGLGSGATAYLEGAS